MHRALLGITMPAPWLHCKQRPLPGILLRCYLVTSCLSVRRLLQVAHLGDPEAEWTKDTALTQLLHVRFVHARLAW